MWKVSGFCVQMSQWAEATRTTGFWGLGSGTADPCGGHGRTESDQGGAAGPSSPGSSQLSATLLNFLTLRLPLPSLLQTETTPIFTPAGHPRPAAALLGLIPHPGPNALSKP